MCFPIQRCEFLDVIVQEEVVQKTFPPLQLFRTMGPEALSFI